MGNAIPHAPRIWWRRLAGAVALLWALAPVGCRRDAPAPAALQVLAASSLTEGFTALAQAFERAHPGARVALTFAGSQVLRLQIEQGAPADVFASANPAHLDALVAGGQAQAPRTFARNGLVIIVPPGNPAQVHSLADLARAQRLVLGTPEVPVGRYARQVLAKADARLGAGFADRVLARVVSAESNVRLVRAKVAMGEADAALVYRTDAVGAGVTAIPLPDAVNVQARYPQAVLTGARSPALAQQWVDFVGSPAGQAILATHGFLPAGP